MELDKKPDDANHLETADLEVHHKDHKSHLIYIHQNDSIQLHMPGPIHALENNISETSSSSCKKEAFPNTSPVGQCHPADRHSAIIRCTGIDRNAETENRVCDDQLPLSNPQSKETCHDIGVDDQSFSMIKNGVNSETIAASPRKEANCGASEQSNQQDNQSLEHTNNCDQSAINVVLHREDSEPVTVNDVRQTSLESNESVQTTPKDCKLLTGHEVVKQTSKDCGDDCDSASNFSSIGELTDKESQEDAHQQHPDELKMLRAQVDDLSMRLLRSQRQMEDLLEEKQKWLTTIQQPQKPKTGITSDTAAIVVKFAQVFKLLTVGGGSLNCFHTRCLFVLL